jgi:hypothetical protein
MLSSLFVHAFTTGYGTFYGSDGGGFGQGACKATIFPPGFDRIALNSEQWDSAAHCGACVSGVWHREDGDYKFNGIM